MVNTRLVTTTCVCVPRRVEEGRRGRRGEKERVTAEQGVTTPPPGSQGRHPRQRTNRSLPLIVVLHRTYTTRFPDQLYPLVHCLFTLHSGSRAGAAKSLNYSTSSRLTAFSSTPPLGLRSFRIPRRRTLLTRQPGFHLPISWVKGSRIIASRLTGSHGTLGHAVNPRSSCTPLPPLEPTYQLVSTASSADETSCDGFATLVVPTRSVV